ncbi:DUF6776 family protein [Alteromonas halophila]|uniref:Uncharacterized protein n=1 Tax=Alteromonas halophila TaxID=516698 RepID=A0A918JNK8_9ALTE|nr:DUF6776 family protein [Alteromonas halophila]GGW92960.1 hypothetical protein GCM10007391_29020 [Alteromonas halophila]
MDLHTLRKKFGSSALTLIVFVCLLLMLVFGYWLASYQHQQAAFESKSRTQTLREAEDENRALAKKLSQRTAELTLSRMELEQTTRQMVNLEEEVAALREQLGFYQRVMAPENTQDGFFVDGITVTPAASHHHFRLQFVLLQQRNNKAVIKGELAIAIRGSLEGKPHVVTTANTESFADGPVAFRFTFFQNVDINIQLPDAFIPESLTFSANVYQYTTLRGQYEATFDWQQVLSVPNGPPAHTQSDENTVSN